MRRLALLLAGLAAAMVVGAALMFAPVREHWRTHSPDGVFVAIARVQPFYAMIPVMPGGGSDKPGRVTVYRGGQSCGSVWVHMVSQAYQLRWEFDRKPRRAEIGVGATWNLDDCSLESVFGE
jgi:hypothetical protein